MSNKPNSARVSPGGAGRNREIRSTKLEIRKMSDGLRMSIEVANEPNWPGGPRLGITDCRLGIGDWGRRRLGTPGRGMSNKPNLLRFGAENEDRRKNKANFRRGRRVAMRQPSASRRLPLPPGYAGDRKCQTNPISQRRKRTEIGRGDKKSPV